MVCHSNMHDFAFLQNFTKNKLQKYIFKYTVIFSWYHVSLSFSHGFRLNGDS